MKIIKTSIEGLIVLEPLIYYDERGYFFESFKQSLITKLYPKLNFTQVNESFSKKHVLRGLHYQKPPYDQHKLVKVVKGEIIDVVVDLRPKSETYLKYEKFTLSSTNKKQLLVPAGFAHGFYVLSDEAIVQYHVDKEYNKESEGGLRYDSDFLEIDWGIIDYEKIKVSEKDLLLPKEFNGFGI